MNGKYNGKLFSFLGDSITTLDGYNPYGYPVYYAGENQYRTNVFTINDTWWGQVLIALGGTLLVNNSWSGSTVCKPPYSEAGSYGCSEERTSSLGAEGISPDHIIIHMGTNDRGYRLRVTDSGTPDDLTVIENAYSLMLKRIRENYPDAVIWCCTLAKTKITSDPRFVFPEYNGNTPMSDYSYIIKKAAAAHGARIVDLESLCELCDTVDSLHPTSDGMRTISSAVIAELDRQASEP